MGGGHTVQPINNGHLGAGESQGVVEKWPLWGGRGVIRQILIKEYNIFIVLCSCLLCPKMLHYFFFFLLRLCLLYPMMLHSFNKNVVFPAHAEYSYFSAT